jgi:rare lipoprotein A
VLVRWFLLLGLLVLAACAPRAARPDARDERRGAVGEGLASFYGPGLAGRPTASGERFNPDAYTAAHRSARFGTCLRVVNLENGRSVKVRVNDRGPFVAGRVIDVSQAAARVLGMLERGLARVRLFACGGERGDAPPHVLDDALADLEAG